MSKIWKYPIDWSGEPFTRSLPTGATFLSAQLQRGEPVMWFAVDPAQPEVDRTFVVTGTGFTAPSGTYRATFQLYAGDLVLHLFEIGNGS